MPPGLDTIHVVKWLWLHRPFQACAVLLDELQVVCTCQVDLQWPDARCIRNLDYALDSIVAHVGPR